MSTDRSIGGAGVKFGVFLNNRGAVFLGEDYSLGSLIQLAVDAENLGFEFVSVGDSVLAKPRYAAIPVLSAIAVATKSVELTTGILQPHLRPPVQLAQEWATLDTLSLGRTTLGVGLGTGPKELVDLELRLVGLSRSRRARAFEEAIQLLRLLWSGEAVNFKGQIYELAGVVAGYGPIRSAGVPILIACGAYVSSKAGYGPNDVHRPEVAGTIIGPFERVARLGDGWISGLATPAEWREVWLRLQEEGSKLDRQLDSAAFERRLNVFVHISPEGGVARSGGKEFMEAYHRLPMDDETLDRWLIAGGADSCAERVNEYIAAGVNSFQFVLASRDQRGQLEQLADALGRPSSSAKTNAVDPA